MILMKCSWYYFVSNCRGEGPIKCSRGKLSRFLKMRGGGVFRSLKAIKWTWRFMFFSQNLQFDPPPLKLGTREYIFRLRHQLKIKQYRFYLTAKFLGTVQRFQGMQKPNMRLKWVQTLNSSEVQQCSTMTNLWNTAGTFLSSSVINCDQVIPNQPDYDW